jgi:ankyrin repeat protein
LYIAWQIAVWSFRVFRSLIGWAVAAPLLAAAGLAAAADTAPLIQAVKHHDRVAVNSLLDRGADVDAVEGDGSTALHWAAQGNDGELVEALLEAGASPNAATRFGVTPLELAGNNGNRAMIERLVAAGADPNSVSREGQTPLMSAARAGRVDAVQALLEHGARVDAAEEWRGQTALMLAAGEGHVEVARTLVEAGANVTATAKSGFTPLLFAVRNAHVDMIRLLLDHGANVNDRAPDGTSALNVAVVNAFYEAASVLLDYGADPNLPDARASPLHTIAWLRKPGSTGDAGVGDLPPAAPLPVGKVTSLELAQKLLDHGADPNVRVDWQEMRFDTVGGITRNPPGLVLGRHLLTYNGATAFYVAAKNGDAELMRLLAANGADPSITNRFGITPLMVAAGLDTWEGETPGPFTGVSEAERLEAVEAAVELGNDINAVADFGDYPMTGDPEYTLLYYPHNIADLLDLGTGDPRWSGSTALHGAIISNQPSIVQYLVDHGARLDAKTETGWTPLMMSRGVFLTNTGREFPAAEKILLDALAKRDARP